MFASDQTFMEHLAENYPDIDWDNLPDLESAPDVFTIQGQIRYRYVYKTKGKESKGYHGFTFGKAFATREEAEVALEQLKHDPQYSEEHLHGETCFTDTYLGPLIWDQMRIEVRKPTALVDLHMMRAWRADILSGKKIFPMYLP